VLGVDGWGREVLTFLPGQVLDGDDPEAEASDALLADAARWLRGYHDAVADFAHPGPWRTGPPPVGDEIVCHHDFAPYNMAWSSSADGPRLVGVFDWDMAGAGDPIDDLAFLAWNGVPLYRPRRAPADDARRLTAIAHGYGGPSTAEQILDHVVTRIGRAVRVIAAGQEAGDPGMVNLAARGEPARTAARLDDLVGRVPAIAARLRG
jgi:hypothetical protein